MWLHTRSLGFSKASFFPQDDPYRIPTAYQMVRGLVGAFLMSDGIFGPAAGHQRWQQCKTRIDRWCSLKNPIQSSRNLRDIPAVWWKMASSPCSLGELPRMITLMLARRPCRRPWERSTRPPWKHHGAPTSFCKTPEKVGDSPKKLQIYIIYIIWLDFIQQKSLDSEGCPPTFEVSRRPWMALDSARRWSLQGMVSGSSLIFVLQRWEAAWFFS